MKKTIAILLILVIGMVGVFAADERTEATVKLETAIAEIVAVGVTEYEAAENAGLSIDSFASYGKFEDDTKDSVTFDTITDMNDFVEGQNVAFLHAFSNSTTGATITVSGSEFEATQTSGSTTTVIGTVPYTLTIPNYSNGTILLPSTGAEGNNNQRVYVMNAVIKVAVLQEDVDLAPAADYTSTITFNIASI